MTRDPMNRGRRPRATAPSLTITLLGSLLCSLPACDPGEAAPELSSDELDLATAASTTRYTVDKTADSTDGRCVANRGSGGRCNLRAAVAAALLSPGPVQIVLGVDAKISLGQMLLAASASNGSPSLSIDGAKKRITGSNNSRLFSVGQNVSLALKNLTVTAFTFFDGGAIANDGKLSLQGVTLLANAVACVGTGAMTSNAFCSGGAIANRGQLTIGGGSKFERNKLTASASSASFTFASASGGAITSSGSLIINGPVSFTGNLSDATAASGFHPGPGGASASSGGGAIASSGSLSVTGGAIGKCSFTGNIARASATTAQGSGSASSAGGAISQVGGQLQIPNGACSFSNNQAQTNPDINVIP